MKTFWLLLVVACSAWAGAQSFDSVSLDCPYSSPDGTAYVRATVYGSGSLYCGVVTASVQNASGAWVFSNSSTCTDGAGRYAFRVTGLGTGVNVLRVNSSAKAANCSVTRARTAVRTDLPDVPLPLALLAALVGAALWARHRSG